MGKKRPRGALQDPESFLASPCVGPSPSVWMKPFISITRELVRRGARRLFPELSEGIDQPFPRPAAR